MVYVGIDLHRKRSHVAVVEEDGSQTLSRRLLNDREAFRALVGELGTDAEFALEATYGWEWLAELLEDAGCELDLAHPHARVPTLTTAADDYAGGPYGLGGGRRCGADRGSRRDPAAVQRGVRCDRRPLADDREPGQPRVVADAGARGMTTLRAMRAPRPTVTSRSTIAPARPLTASPKRAHTRPSRMSKLASR
jgi:transposase